MSSCRPDIFDARCPSRAVFETLAEKWSMLILHRLVEGPRRPSELRRSIGGISDKMLVQTLRSLERNGFVARRNFAEVPPRVEYALTDLGRSLAAVVRDLDQWVETHFFDIADAQGAYDRARAAGRPAD
ncbi:MAG: helix-turn-helix transcriptional regulator [Methylobacteriaceae bacterium]|nr:helix-turn-helix transcriptional regulator [Methylobacteriaceae bacterium]